MPRLFRKFDPSKSSIISSKHNKKQSIQMSESVGKFDNSKTYKTGQGYGSQRTYLCINPYRQMSKNREFANQMRSLGHNDTDKALFQLEENYSQISGRKPLHSKFPFDISKQNLNEPSLYGDGIGKQSGSDFQNSTVRTSKAQPSPKKIELPAINK
jgi:hypothetical protein